MSRILLVDDENIARAIYGDALTAGGHEVLSVGSVLEAKEALATHPFDIVVTDLLLPHGDGMEILQYAKERAPSVEVIVITALDKVGPAVRAIKSGAAEYLIKPVAPVTLQHAINRALTTHDLLRENASLRAHVALLEAGQRIATNLDRDKLGGIATHALRQLTGASGALLVVPHGQELRVQSADGFTPEIEKLLVDQAERLIPSSAGAAVELDGVVPGKSVWAWPAVDGETVFGHVVLAFDGAPPSSARETAAFLARHVGLAWRNLDRFAEVEDLAYLDDLTHLFNMRYFHHVVDKDLAAAKQSGVPVSVLFLDLDLFKSVNDTHGHLVGSRLLVEVGRIIKGCVRDNDVVARYGGDEYVVLLRGTDSGGALKVAERIRRTVESHRFLAREGYSLTITTCVGVASFPEHGHDQATIVDLADRAMYRGKKSTRNVVYIAAGDLEATPADRHSSAEPEGEGRAGTGS